jgi:hypothetical protein
MVRIDGVMLDSGGYCQMIEEDRGREKEFDG